MAAQLPTIRYGILKCRDLVQLYFGARLVTVAIDSWAQVSADTPAQVLPQDPRRISYELWLSPQNNGNDDISIATTQDALFTAASLDLNALSGATLYVKRTWYDDGDSVVQPLWAEPDSFTWSVSVRQILLQAAPVDEGP